MNSSVTKRAVYYQKAEDLYVSRNFSIETITALLENKVSPATISRWKDEYNWDAKRKKYLDLNKSLIDEAKDLVVITIGIAKGEPTPANITAYKRAIEALAALEKINEKNENKEEAGRELTIEKIEEFAIKAGLR